MQLNPVHLKVAGLLKDRLFRIPEYQRAYSWTSRQRADLFNDIVEAHRSGREHFMATVVTLLKTTRSINADEYREVELVDGQQRLTSLIILLKAIEKALVDEIEKKLRTEIADLLVKSDSHSLLLLQTNHDTSNVFTTYVRSGQIEQSLAQTYADQNLINAATESEAFVQEWSQNKTLIELIATIRNRLSVIYHELNDEATVYRVFEVLNSRGLDVKWIDKLKSQLMALIFEHVEGGTRKEAINEMQVIWQIIYRTLGLEVSLGDEALRFAGTWVFAPKPNRILSQEEAAAALTQHAGTKLKDITVCATWLKTVVLATHELDRNIRLKAVTRILHARFLAIAIILRKFDTEAQDDLLKQWEKTTFRIFGLGGADTRYKVGEYVRLAYEIITTPVSAQEVMASIKSLGKGFDIDEVIKNGNWFESYDGWTEELRYVLYRYDEDLALKAGEKVNTSQWNKIWSDDPAKSIEHIQPQSSEVRYIHHLGNLTMLPPGVNSSLKDKPPKKKASTYKSCGLRGTAAVGSSIEDRALWNEKTALARADEILKFVAREWAD